MRMGHRVTWLFVFVNRAPRLARHADRERLRQLRAVSADHYRYWITLACDHVVDMARRIEQRPFPVGMLRFGDHMTPWNACLLQRPGMLSAVHQQRYGAWQFAKIIRECSLHRDAATRIHLSFSQSDGRFAPH